MQVRIEAFLIDDQNEDEFAGHGVTVREVLQVQEGERRVFRNKGGRGRAPYGMIGLTSGGRLLTIPIDPTQVPGIWRPRTTFDSSTGEASRYRK